MVIVSLKQSPVESKVDSFWLGPLTVRKPLPPIDGHFFIRVPFGRFINPITKTDWEGTGVETDIKVKATDALDEALKRARSGP